MFDWLRKLVRSSKPDRRNVTAAQYAMLKARYDAASTTLEALKNWSNVDGLGAQAAVSPDVRAIIRNRGRHELLNNPYMDGIVQTHAGDIVGKGPRLRVRTGVKAVDTPIERAFASWTKAVKLARRMRLAVETWDAQGEIFIALVGNPKLNHPIKFDIRLYEGDQCATPDLFAFQQGNRQAVDGIEFDAYGNPAFYHFLREHPGDTTWTSAGPLQYDRIPADRVIHLFRERRPGQRRGIPRITSSLSLFPERRSFRHSVLTAARVAAQLGAAFLKANFDPDTDDGDQDNITAGSTLELEAGMITALPVGYEAQQMKAEQPATTYREFDDKLIGEGARPLNMPSNIALCNSSGYNYASGRLDHQTYDRSTEIDQSDLENDILDPLLFGWLAIAIELPGYLPWRTAAVLRGGLPHSWLWRKRPHVDPQKEANAQKTRLASNTTTIAREVADQGLDFEDHVEELMREIEWYRNNGLKHPAEQSATPPAPSPDLEPELEDEDEDEDEGEGETAQAAKPERNGRHRNRLMETVR